MQEQHTISFKVTPSQKETIELRVKENGFDDIAAYLKVVSLNTHPFNLTPTGFSQEEPSIELSFNVSTEQKKRIEENVDQSECETLEQYIQYVGQHGVVSAVIEVRSTGTLDAMLARIAASKQQ